MKTIQDMAREAQLPYFYQTGETANLKQLEAFAALVRAEEAEKHKWDIHSCGPTCKRYACVAMREAVQRPWVGLTDEERINISYKANGNECVAVELTETKLKEKNT
jgi:hypothetical protein